MSGGSHHPEKKRKRTKVRAAFEDATAFGRYGEKEKRREERPPLDPGTLIDTPAPGEGRGKKEEGLVSNPRHLLRQGRREERREGKKGKRGRKGVLNSL